jgi:hypothetical protein
MPRIGKCFIPCGKNHLHGADTTTHARVALMRKCSVAHPSRHCAALSIAATSAIAPYTSSAARSLHRYAASDAGAESVGAAVSPRIGEDVPGVDPSRVDQGGGAQGSIRVRHSFLACGGHMQRPPCVGSEGLYSGSVGSGAVRASARSSPGSLGIAPMMPWRDRMPAPAARLLVPFLVPFPGGNRASFPRCARLALEGARRLTTLRLAPAHPQGYRLG